jgi:hypothetical protein
MRLGLLFLLVTVILAGVACALPIQSDNNSVRTSPLIKNRMKNKMGGALLNRIYTSSDKEKPKKKQSTNKMNETSK